MELKFIGANGSMGLEHGRVYDVKIQTKNKFIWVDVDMVEIRHMIFTKRRCPYASPQALSANWCLP